MKNIRLLLASVLFTLKCYSQGTIQNISVFPANPTTSDIVVVYADLQFSSMGCQVDNQGHTTSGSNTNASAHHCLGMLSAICNRTDTFNLGTLQAGPHIFQLTLSSGFGGPPCSPGIVPDDTETFSFNVSLAAGISENTLSPVITIFPNPVVSSSVIRFSSPGSKGVIRILDVIGQEVQQMNFSGPEVPLDKHDLQPGVYFILIESDHQKAFSKFLVQ
ncbi:MAG TPA: T9SS type A sorting domain-containing protein [Bacteroidia bacterium]|jgi:hypothetical protein